MAILITAVLAALIGYAICDIRTMFRGISEYSGAYAKGKYHGYIMALNDKFYGDDRLAEVKSDAGEK